MHYRLSYLVILLAALAAPFGVIADGHLERARRRQERRLRATLLEEARSRLQVTQLTPQVDGARGAPRPARRSNRPSALQTGN